MNRHGPMQGPTSRTNIFEDAVFYLPLISQLSPKTGTATPTFTRASIAAGGGNSTSVDLVSSGEPRFRGDRGVIIEQSFTNMLWPYNDLTDPSHWETTRASWLSAPHTAPDGTTSTVIELQEDTTGAPDTRTHYFRKINFAADGGSWTNSANYVAGVFVKQGDTSVAERQPAIAFHGGADNDGWATKYAVIYLDTSTGVVGLVESGAIGVPPLDYGAIPYPNGWWFLWALVSVEDDIETYPTTFPFLGMLTTNGGVSYDGNGTSSCLFWGPMLAEAETFYHFLQAESAVQTKAADSLIYTIPSEYTTTGTIYCEFTMDSALSGGTGTGRQVFGMQDATETLYYIFARLLPTGNELIVKIRGNDGVRYETTIGTNAEIQEGVNKLAIAYGGGTNDIAYLNGNPMPELTNLSGNAVPTAAQMSAGLHIGRDDLGKYLNGCLKDFALWNTKKGAAELQSMTI